jgi:hypothetical protein
MQKIERLTFSRIGQLFSLLNLRQSYMLFKDSFKGTDLVKQNLETNMSDKKQL